jgi:hypothetical protein
LQRKNKDSEMEPINYLAQVADPFAQATQGLKLGAGMADLEAQRALVARQQQQQQLAMQEQARFFTNPNPTMRDAARYASLLTPEQSKAFLPFMEGISKEQQQGTLKTTGQLLSALQTNPQVFITQAKEKALAARNSGDEDDATLFEQLAEAAADPQRGPAIVFKSLAARTAGIPGAKEMFETIDKSLGTAREEALAPEKLREQTAKAGEAESSAQKSAVAAKFAESNAVIDLQKKGWDITKIQSDIDIAKQNSRIAAMNAATAREGNALKRQENELKLKEMIDKRDATVREKVADIESARADMDNFLNTADRILATPKNVVARAAGPIDARMIPTFRESTADFEALVETLGSQAFMAQIPKLKGAGALSDAEGKKLQSSLQNLSLSQSPERLLENVKEAQRLIMKGRANLSRKAGLPESIPDTPAVQTSPSDIDALVKKYGG